MVLADRPCGALEIAGGAGIGAELVLRSDFTPSFDREGYTKEVVTALERHEVDLVAIAGFGTILSKSFVDTFGSRAVNTHPALLPAFKGWHAVRDALAQEAVPVLDDDTEASLHERIKQVERRLYPDVIERLVEEHRTGARP